MNYVPVEDKGVMQCTCGGDLTFNMSSEEDVERYYDLIDKFDRLVLE